MPHQVHQFVPVWMAPVSPQDFRPYSFEYWEAGNSENFRVMWENAIQGGADWVQLITWNDYSEHTAIAPSACTQSGFYELAAYYVVQFKTGQPPALTRDGLYYFYRRHSTAAQPARQSKLIMPKTEPLDPPRDEIELLAMLTAPGELEIEINGRIERREAASGMTSFRVPLCEGWPIFRLRRAGQAVIVLPGALQISDRIDYQDFLYHAGRSPLKNSATEAPPVHR